MFSLTVFLVATSVHMFTHVYIQDGVSGPQSLDLAVLLPCLHELLCYDYNYKYVITCKSFSFRLSHDSPDGVHVITHAVYQLTPKVSTCGLLVHRVPI